MAGIGIRGRSRAWAALIVYGMLLPSAYVAGSAPAAAVAAEYPAVLASTRNAVGVNLGRVVGTGSLDALDSALQAAAVGIEDESARLSDVLPPEQLTGAHAELVVAMTTLAGDLRQVNDDVRARRLCAASSVLATIGELPSVATLRQVTAQFAGTIGAEPWDNILPPPGVPTDRRLPNGQIVVDNRASGGSLFEVDNGAQLDAVVTLAQADRAIVSVYVASMDQVTVSSLPIGGYEVFFTQGRDWDDAQKIFARDCLFSRFDGISEFTRTEYWQFGLEPIVGGNAPTTEVAPENYPTG